MKSISVYFKKDFVEAFKKACEQLGVAQSEVIKEAMQMTIDKAKEDE